jgi:hypothetical protein
MSGCSLHRAFLFDRGGERRIGELGPLTQVRWGRSRDDTSIGNVFIRTPSSECGRVIAEAEPGRHELVIYRAGVRVWEGPITRTDENGTHIEVDAKDITHYLNRTIMRQGYDNSYPKIAYATERVRKIITQEVGRKEALSPPVNIIKHLRITTHKKTAKTSRRTVPYEKYVFEDLDTLAAKGGIDYTVVGRSSSTTSRTSSARDRRCRAPTSTARSASVGTAWRPPPAAPSPTVWGSGLPPEASMPTTARSNCCTPSTTRTPQPQSGSRIT